MSSMRSPSLPTKRSRSAAKAPSTASALPVLARAHSDAEVRHLLSHGADGAVMAERELAYSLAEMVMSTPTFRYASRETAVPPV